MNVFRILYVVLLAALYVVPGRHALQIYQQTLYELSSYAGWLKKNCGEVLKQARIPLVLSLIFCLLGLLQAGPVWQNLLLAVTALLAFWEIQQERKAVYIKPLVLTRRVQRQCAVLVVLALLLNLLFVRLRPLWLLGLGIGAASLLPWVLVWPLAWITDPIEHAVHQKYLQEARNMLQKNPDLIRIGITGSYGKTTTKNIVQAIVSEQYLSLMTPASYNTPMGITRTIREQLKPVHQVFVCEMGADHVGDITELMHFVEPSIGIVTAIGPQHLATFGSQEAITKEKMQMIELLPAGGTGILNWDNALIRAYQPVNPVRLIRYGIEREDVDYRAVEITYGAFGSRFRVQAPDGEYDLETRLLGRLNILNILAGIAAARALDIDWNRIRTAVKQMKQVEHRLEQKYINGYRFLDDAFNANPSGAAMALDVLSFMPGRRIIVTPGMIELGEQQEQINYTFGTQMKGKADMVLLVGDRQIQPILRGLQDAGFDPASILVVDSIQEAFRWIWQNADKDDTILLENDLPDAYSR